MARLSGTRGLTGPAGVDGVDGVDASLLMLETGPHIANYTIQLSDLNKVVTMDGTTLTVFVPLDADSNFAIGSVVHMYNLDAATFTVAGVAGVTVRNAGTVPQYQRIAVRKRADNEWVMYL